MDYKRVMDKQKVSITCGIWPYLSGQKLTVKGYTTLKGKGIRMQIFDKDILELRLGKKVAIIGMTPTLRRQLKKEAEKVGIITGGK